MSETFHYPAILYKAEEAEAAWDELSKCKQCEVYKQKLFAIEALLQSQAKDRTLWGVVSETETKKEKALREAILELHQLFAKTEEE